MDKRAVKFLNKLRDGRWHRKGLWKDGIGINTIEACVYLGLAEKKLWAVGKDKNIPWAPDHWVISFRLTPRGKSYLKNGEREVRKIDFQYARSIV